MITLSRPKSMILLASTSALVAVLAWVSISHSAQATAQEAAPKAAKAALTVSVTQPTRNPWPRVLSVNGSIAAWQESTIGAEAGGLRLEEVLVNVGDRVRKGQQLARLQSDTVGIEREQTRASLQEALATLADAGANANRARQLQSTGAMSAQQISELLTAEKTANARAAVLKARLKADDLRMAQTRILAPDDGAISARLATVGAVVQAGQELFRLIRRERLEWRAEVPAGDLLHLKPGMKATIYTASGSAAPGTIRTVAPTVDAQTRNGLVYIDITQARDAKAGMFARGEIQLGSSDALTLPQAAVQLRDGFHYVFRVGADNKVSQTKVTVGRRAGERIEIVSGIDIKTRVASSGVGFLVDGDTVRVAAEPAASSQPAAAGKSS